MTGDVLISEAVLDQLKVWSAASAPYETGGILLGILGDERPWIVRAVEVRSRTPRQHAYEVPSGATTAVVLRAREDDGRLGYAGDWHSHPADKPASFIDLRTLRRAVTFAFRHSEPPPILIVVRLAPGGWVVDVTANRAWRQQAVRVTLTGPHPPFQSESSNSDAADESIGWT